jgi:hypothetical protein
MTTILAKKMMLTPTQAIALPEVITRCAEVGNLTESQFVMRALGDAALREFVREICVTVSK